MNSASIVLALVSVAALSGCAGNDGAPNPMTLPVSTMSSSQTTPNTNGSKTYSDWDLTLAYPASFYVEKYNDEFQSGQTNLRITSQKGSLFRSAGGPGTPKSNEFSTGYEMTIAKLISGQDPVGTSKLEKTSNPLVKKISFECDGVGCGSDQYFVSTKKGQYIIRVNYIDYNQANSVTDSIINSIKE